MLRAAAVFSDHMVLQRELPIAVFGEADGPVTVSLAGVRAEARVENGRFLAYLPPMSAGGPYELRLFGGGETAVLRDVMVGEVWLCGGQSNMEFRLRDAKGGAQAVATGDDPLLRFYTVNQEARVDAVMLARERATAWKALAPGNCGDVSAVAYYAGARLREALGVPVGMLICCVGGTEAACWISEAALSSFPAGQARLEVFEAQIAGVSDARFEQENAAYEARVAAWCAASDKMKAERPDLRAGDIARAVGDFPWPPPVGRGMLRHPGNLWATMTARVTPYAARGLFWYQGETDALAPAGYDALFGRLIAEWRRGFDNDALWVVAAQLPGYGADPAVEDWPSIRRDQQRVADADPRCALACLLDCGESGDIHPWDKRTPGRRMAELALEKVYGLAVAGGAESARLKEATWENGAARLRFTRSLLPLRGSARSLLVNGQRAEKAVIEEGELVIPCDVGARITYAWENDPEPCLFGENALPVFPFEIVVPN